MDESSSLTPQPQPQGIGSSRRSVSLGLIGTTPRHGSVLTPQGAGLLVNFGMTVRLEQGAGEAIHYSDSRYRAQGVDVVTRDQALDSDIILAMGAPLQQEVPKMRRGATVLSIWMVSEEEFAAYIQRSITFISLGRTLIDGQPQVSLVTTEIAGRAAIIDALARLTRGESKNILPCGVFGVTPLETMVIGANQAGQAACQQALGAGMTVRLFDNDVMRLKGTSTVTNDRVIASTCDPAVIGHALRTADVVIDTGVNTGLVIDADVVATMKKDVLIYCLTLTPSKVFKSLPMKNCLERMPRERCVFNQPQLIVRRTLAMAYTNVIVPVIKKIVAAGSVGNALRMYPGIARAVCTYGGHPTCDEAARSCGQRKITIELMLRYQ